jgi:antitoxin CcdA
MRTLACSKTSGGLTLRSIDDLNAPKKNINYATALEQSPRQRQSVQWLAENRLAILAYNVQVEENGVFSDGLRSF